MKKAGLFLLVLCLFAPQAARAEREYILAFRGVSLSGAEFGNNRRLPGKHGRDYQYPSQEDIALYADFGMNTVRVPFLWERLQRNLNAPFDEDELDRLDDVVDEASDRNLTVILDPHNYGKYNGQAIGSTQVPVSAYTDFLSKLAKHYKKNKHVVFELMNKPHRQTADEWAQIAQEGIMAIRQTGAQQLILVSGTLYSEGNKWNRKAGLSSNAEALSRIDDPLKNIAFDIHQYFDVNATGTHSTCEDELVGERRLMYVTQWLRAKGRRGFLSDFGSSSNPQCLVALKRTLEYMEKNGDVWLGWTYWAASSWHGDYMFSLYPPDPEKVPQAKVIKEFL